MDTLQYLTYLKEMHKQLIWSVKNFYKDPASDFALVWLDRILFWKEQIRNYKELFKSE